MNAENSLNAYATDRSEDAFRQFVGRYANLVFSIAKRRLGNPSLAEDVTQSVFIRIAQTPPPSRDEANLIAWLHRVTTNAAIDAWRAESRRREREQAAILMQTDSATFSDHEQLAENLDEALDALREPDRQAILLRYFRGHRISEVGRLLGISEDAAKMRIHRALDALRQNLSARGVTCASPILLSFLMDRAVEAAPATVASNLAALKASAAWTAPATSTTFTVGLGLKALLLFLLLGGAITFLVLTRKPVDATPPPLQPLAVTTAPTAGVDPQQPRTISPIAPDESITGEPLTVLVVDAQNNKPIAGAHISGPYWGPGGVTAGRLRATTTADGLAEFPPLNPSRDGSVNLFVTAPNYVPICFRWKTKTAPSFTAPLDPAQTVAGIILDEQGAPVSGATIRLRGPSADDPYKNIAFNHDDAGVTSWPDGRFVYPFAPRNWDTLKFRITKEDHPLTDTNVVVAGQNLSELTLILKTGVALTGFVTTEDGAPILGATVRELSNWGSTPPNGTTDASGAYMLRGLDNHYVDRGYKVIVQAEGFRPEIRELKLNAPTNYADFKLSKGIHFHGRVIDEAGNPVPGAVIRTDSGSDGLDPYKWIGHADSQGRFEWNSAPAEETLFWFEANGYVIIRGMRITPDNNPRDITLHASPAR